MAIEISLAQFNRIASGEYNAGQIDVKTGKDGTAELVKVNNHVWRTSKNNVHLAAGRVLEIKEAFLAALAAGGVKKASLDEIRAQLGLDNELAVTGDHQALHQINLKRFKPLTRAEVRSILDQYANAGRGFTQASQAAVSLYDVEDAMRATNASAKTLAKRDAVNAAAPEATIDNFDFGLTDAISLLSTTRSLKEFDEARAKRVAEGNLAGKNMLTATMRNAFSTLFGVAQKMLPAGVRESETFNFFGLDAKLVKDENGLLAAVIGSDPTATRVALGKDAETFFGDLMNRAVKDMKTLGKETTTGLLEAVYDNDISDGILASDRTSTTRRFAALIVEGKNPGVAGLVMGGEYNTGTLVEIAEHVIAGDDKVGVTKESLDAYHAQVMRSNAELPEDMKAMLEQVATMPLEKPENGELIVRQPMAAPINQVIAAIPPPPPGPVPVVPRDIGGAEGIKNFVADLVFSDDTMVGDVTVNRPGEKIRSAIAADDKKIIALAEILKNPAVLDVALAPSIAGVVKEGFEKIAAAIAKDWQKATGNGETLAQSMAKDDFVGKFSLFFKDSQKLTGATLAQFDAIIQTMANKGCEQIQGFINEVFKIDPKNANAAGALTSEPYKDLSPEEIKAQLDKKSLNDILDSASTSDAPGQVGFFKQVMSTYFKELGKADKRSCFAAAMRYANPFDFAGKTAEEADSLNKAALNKFTGAVLKGTSPLLQKMMQGLPKEIMGDFADALADMKSHLAPIPRKIVQAHLNKMIADSKGKIEKIEVVRSLGAASVGEAFLCKFTHTVTRPKTEFKNFKEVNVLGEDGNPVMETKVVTENLVVKIMRHDAERRVESEAKIFTSAAEKIPGMAKTWEGQLKQYMTEFDFRNEAANVNEGRKLYGIKGNDDHPLNLVAPAVDSMKLSDAAKPQKNVMVANVALGSTADSFFKDATAQIRKAASAVFKQDPATGRILWQDGPVDPATGKPKKAPVFKENVPAMAVATLSMYLSFNADGLQNASKCILQATKAWFQNAIIGDGQFHGDTHSGNLMIARDSATFIDFGNLYQLKVREDGVNEKTELLRVILGAAFRDKGFLLDGMKKLMTPEGRSNLEDKNIRAKAEAILDSVLDKSKGSFSFNIVYRLQAAVIELQKLGLELPPQINCFIQSLVRLSNAVTEINTIVNQSRALLDAANNIAIPPPQRDELDLLGQEFDIFASEAGHALVPKNPAKPNGAKIPAYKQGFAQERFGGRDKLHSPIFDPDGAYTQKVVARLSGAAAPVAEAEKLRDTLVEHADTEHGFAAEHMANAAKAAFETFETEFKAAKSDEAAKSAAIQKFAESFASAEQQILNAFEMGLLSIGEGRVAPPNTFASAVTDILFDNFSRPDVQNQFTAADALYLGMKAKIIATTELGAGFFAGADKVVDAIQKDGKALPSDNSYKVDIGV